MAWGAAGGGGLNTLLTSAGAPAAAGDATGVPSSSNPAPALPPAHPPAGPAAASPLARPKAEAVDSEQDSAGWTDDSPPPSTACKAASAAASRAAAAPPSVSFSADPSRLACGGVMSKAATSPNASDGVQAPGWRERGTPAGAAAVAAAAAATATAAAASAGTPPRRRAAAAAAAAAASCSWICRASSSRRSWADASSALGGAKGKGRRGRGRWSARRETKG